MIVPQRAMWVALVLAPTYCELTCLRLRCFHRHKIRETGNNVQAYVWPRRNLHTGFVLGTVILVILLWMRR